METLRFNFKETSESITFVVDDQITIYTLNGTYVVDRIIYIERFRYVLLCENGYRFRIEELNNNIVYYFDGWSVLYLHFNNYAKIIEQLKKWKLLPQYLIMKS